MSNRIKLFGVKWEVDTAGPSPDCNKRTEMFFFGCQRAMNGNPCKSCFNSKIWDNSKVEFDYSTEELVEQIKKYATNKYITIGGGEPTDQLEGLVELTSKLKAEGFHIMIYTWKNLKDKVFHLDPYSSKHYLFTKTTMKNECLYRKLISNVDIIVDGEFKLEERLYNEDKGDGLLSSVGSGNQIIWDCNAFNNKDDKILKGYAMRNLDGITLNPNDELIYIVKDINCYEEKIIL